MAFFTEVRDGETSYLDVARRLGSPAIAKSLAHANGYKKVTARSKLFIPVVSVNKIPLAGPVSWSTKSRSGSLSGCDSCTHESSSVSNCSTSMPKNWWHETFGHNAQGNAYKNAREFPQMGFLQGVGIGASERQIDSFAALTDNQCRALIDSQMDTIKSALAEKYGQDSANVRYEAMATSICSPDGDKLEVKKTPWLLLGGVAIGGILGGIAVQKWIIK